MNDHDTVKTLVSDDGKRRIRIVHDYYGDNESPREWNPLGNMWARHHRYRLGDVGGHAGTFDDFVDEVEEHLFGYALVTAMLKHLRRRYGSTVILPLYLYDHSGISMWAGGNLLADGKIHLGGWDTSFVGLIFDAPKMDDEWATITDVEAHLRAEVKEYSAHIEGDYFGFIEEDLRTVSTTVLHDGEVVRDTEEEEWIECSSCFGFLGQEHAEGEARAILDFP